MQCSKCGKTLEQNENICFNCGTPVVFQEPIIVIPDTEDVSSPQPAVVDNNIVPNQVNNHVSQNPIPIEKEKIKKNKYLPMIIIIVVTIIVGFIIGLIIFKNVVGEDKPNDGTSEDQFLLDEGVTKYGGYGFIVPEKYTVAGEEDGILNLTESSQKLSLGIHIDKTYSYDDMIQNQEVFLKEYTDEGIKIKRHYERTLDLKDWYVLEIEDSSKNITINFTSLENGVFTLIVTSPNDMDLDSILSDFSKMLLFARSTGIEDFNNKETTKSKIQKFKKLFNK